MKVLALSVVFLVSVILAECDAKGWHGSDHCHRRTDTGGYERIMCKDDEKCCGPYGGRYCAADCEDEEAGDHDRHEHHMSKKGMCMIGVGIGLVVVAVVGTTVCCVCYKKKQRRCPAAKLSEKGFTNAAMHPEKEAPPPYTLGIFPGSDFPSAPQSDNTEEKKIPL